MLGRILVAVVAIATTMSVDALKIVSDCPFCEHKVEYC